MLAVWKFTDVGNQLLSLVTKPLDEAYLEQVATFFLQQGGDPAIAKIRERLPDGRVSYDVVKAIQKKVENPSIAPTQSNN